MLSVIPAFVCESAERGGTRGGRRSSLIVCVDTSTHSLARQTKADFQAPRRNV